MKINFFMICQDENIQGYQIRRLFATLPSPVRLPRALQALAMTVCLLLFAVTSVPAAEISSVNVRLSNNEIYVMTTLKADAKFTEDLKDGLSKKLIFYIDLFRVWSIWPDEFVLGKKIERELRSDQIKREYVGSSILDNVHLEKRFKDLESMVEWSMNIPEIKLTNIKELESGTYFVKVTIESQIRKLPPVIGYFIIFVSEKEFSVSKNSQPFRISTKGVQ